MNQQQITHTDGQLIKMLETVRQKNATPETIQAILQEGIFAAVVDPRLDIGRAKRGLGIVEQHLGPIANEFHFPGSDETPAKKLIKPSVERYYNEEFLKTFLEMTCLKSEARKIFAYRLERGNHRLPLIAKELEPNGILTPLEMFWALNNKEMQTRYDAYLCVTKNINGEKVYVLMETRDSDKKPCFKAREISWIGMHERVLVIGGKNTPPHPLEGVLDW